MNARIDYAKAGGAAGAISRCPWVPVGGIAVVRPLRVSAG
jgi:hypothetical protein